MKNEDKVEDRTSVPPVFNLVLVPPFALFFTLVTNGNQLAQLAVSLQF